MIRNIYAFMQEHYLTFRLLVWLKQCGITRRINYLLSKKEQSSFSFEKEMQASKEFYRNNAERVNRNKELLEDDISREIYDAVIQYRSEGIAIPMTLCSEGDQYFVKGIIDISSGEVFIDGGAYTGDTIQQFINLARKKRIDEYKIIAYEPTNKYYAIANTYFSNNKKVSVINKGISDKDETLFFQDTGVTSKIVETKEEATYCISTEAIDNVELCRNATFIKMDVEGAEMSALKGAKETILKNKPKLAICIYHSDDDMIRIIEYIHELVPEYRLYVRHHTRGRDETVLYAVK